MTLDKISLTLYDFLRALVSLNAISDGILLFAIIAYFMGHVSHAVGSLLKDRWRHAFSNYQLNLSEPLCQ